MKKLIAALLLVTYPAYAWDTYTSDKNWHSIYENKYGGTGSFVRGDPKGNEHAEITDETLNVISPELHQLFGTHSGDQAPRVVDLNASLMRPDLFHRAPVPAAQPGKLEERQLPALSMWAGLPDFNYTVYDWINKSMRCPSLPLDADQYERCHEYRAWLGAGLNSTHMGELGTQVYARHHAIAMKQAERAAELRALLRRGGKSGQLPAGDRWYADYVREAELMALSYETVGQHFMQDRWSIGHMFSRWGGGSYADLSGDSKSGRPSLGRVTSYGTITGIVHGSLAVFGTPDPLSAPYLDYSLAGDDRATPMTWRYSVTNSWFPMPDRSVQRGLGDYYFADVVDDRFDGTVLHPEKQNITPISPAVALKVNTQHKLISHCGGAGLRQVISAFDPQGDRYGEFSLPLPAPDPNRTMPGATANGANPAAESGCTDAWATNDAYYTSARTIAGPTWELGDGLINTLVRAGVTAASGTPQIPDSVRDEFGMPKKDYTPEVLRVAKPVVVVMFRSHVNKRRDERAAKQAGETIVRYGVASARDGFEFKANDITYRPNSAYAVPEYYEPEDLDGLPWFKEDGENVPKPAGGRDLAAIDGFFNKARTEPWCKAMYGSEKTDPKKEHLTLKLLREQGMELEVKSRQGDAKAKELSDRYRAACGYLANRVYKAVDPKYPMTGSRFERIGDHLPLGGAPKYGPTYEPICAYFDGANGTAIRTMDASDDNKPYFIKPGYVKQPGQAGDDGYAPETLENWCEMIPVVEVGKVTNGDPDAAGQIDHLDGDRWLKLSGENLGIKTGTGKVGQVIATDAMGMKRSLDIWDGNLQKETGGWSYDNKTVWARIPGSKKGFPTDATSSMTPEQVKQLPPKKYEFELVRPDDAQARAIYRANGAKTVGRNVVEVNTSWVEQRNLTPAAGSKYKALWVTYPAWSRPDTEVLLAGVYLVTGATYTKVDLAAYGVTVTYKDGEEVMFDVDGNPYWVSAPNKRGYLFSHPIGLPGTVFNGSGTFFFAFH